MSGFFYKSQESLKLFAKETAKRFFQLTLTLLFFTFALRFFEYIFIATSQNPLANRLMLTVLGLGYDAVFVLKISGYLVFLFFLISYFKPKIAEIVFIIISVALLLTNLLLVFYYAKSATPLGADLFGYTVSEIVHTAQASGEINLWMLPSIAALVVISVLAFRFSKKLSVPFFLTYPFLVLLVIVFFAYEDFVPNTKNYQSDFEFYTVINKLQFFSNKAIPYLLHEEKEIIGGDYFIDSEQDKQQTFSYIDKRFPFLRRDSSKNVLGNFFQTTNELPNFVFIITESLGKSFSGKGAIDESFTPFLDSLADHSLYWNNFLSTSGKTFGVFASLFGSLPFAEKGFLDLGEQMPPHFSLISLLKQIGYQTSFYHGGDVRFDNMNIFFKRQNIDFILGDHNFGNGYKRMPAKANGFSWGFGDKELFKRSLEIITQLKKSPRLDIYLTLSMHSPFLIEGQEFYRNTVRTKLKAMDLSPQKKTEYEGRLDMYATVMYTDDAIKYLFEELSKRDDFKNTIFIITGDHRMPNISLKSKLDPFHVPFLIYSPMLKRSEIFSSVSTHFDVLPSLIAFLRENYNVETSKYVTWLGSGLDTMRNFRNVHSVPLMRNKNELLDFLNQKYFIADGEVFEVFDNLFLGKITDPAVQNRLQNYFSEFKLRNKTMVINKTLLPDSVFHFKCSRIK